MTNHNDLSGRTAVVVGASRGLGRGIARAFAKAGAPVVAVARTGPALAELTSTRANIRTEVADSVPRSRPHYPCDVCPARDSVCLSDLRPRLGISAGRDRRPNRHFTGEISLFDFGLLRRSCQISQPSECPTNRSRRQQKLSMRIFLIKRISKLQDQSFRVLAMPLCRFAILRPLVKVRRHYLDSPCKYRVFEVSHSGKSVLNTIPGIFPPPLCLDHLRLYRPGQSLKRPVRARQRGLKEQIRVSAGVRQVPCRQMRAARPK